MSRPSECLALVIGVVMGLCSAYGQDPGVPGQPHDEAPPRQRADFNGDPLPGDSIACLGTNRLRFSQWAQCLAYSPKGDTVAIGSGTQILRWDTSTGKALRAIEIGTRITGLSFFPDGKWMAVTAFSGHVRSRSLKVMVLEPTGWTNRSALAGFHDAPHITVSPDGRWVAYRDSDHLRVWEYANDKTVFSLSPPGSKSMRRGDIAFSPDGKYLAVGGFEGPTFGPDPVESPIILYDLKSGEVAAQLKGHHSEVYSLSFSANGEFFSLAARMVASVSGMSASASRRSASTSAQV